MAPGVLSLWMGERKPYQGGLAVLQQSCPTPSPTFGPCRLEGTLFAVWGISQGPSHDGCGWVEILGVGYQCRSEGSKLCSTIEGATEARFLPLFIILFANQPYFIFPAL